MARDEEKPADQRIDGPESLREKRRDPHPDAASRISDKVRTGALALDPLPSDETGTEVALKRAAENRRPKR
jgi:hypothetical protein